MSPLLARDVFDGAKNTADSFKSWDTCMDNSVCKGVLIALIVVAALLCIWILTSVFRCLFYGAACTQACCCCCSKGLGGRQNYPPQYYEKPSQLVYDNPNMYGAHQMPLYQQPQQQPPVYQGATPYYRRATSRCTPATKILTTNTSTVGLFRMVTLDFWVFRNRHGLGII